MRLLKIFIASSLVITSAFGDSINALNESFDNVRIMHTDKENIYGYAKELGGEEEGFFSYKKSSKIMKFSNTYYRFTGRKFEHFFIENESQSNEKVMEYFRHRYGIKHSDGEKGDAYVFLDYSCPFSREFVKNNELEKLAKEGLTVWVMPISRLGTTDGILNYSALTCSTDNAAKLSRFLGWFDSGEADVSNSEIKSADCYYWLDLKPYYSLMNKLNFDGVPSVYRVEK